MNAAVFLFSLVSAVVTLGLPSEVLAQQHPVRLAVYTFTANQAPTEQNTASTISDLLRLELAREKRLIVLERQDMARLYLDRTAADKMPTVFDPATAVTVGKVLEANYALLGEMRLVDARPFLLLRVVDIATTAIVAVVAERATSDQHELVQSVAKQVIVQLFPQGATGVLEVLATPQSASVRISGDAGERLSPLRLHLTPGVYALSVTPPDDTYKPALLSANVIAGQTTTVDVNLEKRMTTLNVAADVYDALLYIDGEFKGRVGVIRSFQIEAGAHTVALLTPSGAAFRASRYFSADTQNSVPWVRTESELEAAGRAVLISQVDLHRKVTDSVLTGSAVIVGLEGRSVVGLALDSLQPLWTHSDSGRLSHLVSLGDRVAMGREAVTQTSGRYGTTAAVNYSFLSLSGERGGSEWNSGETEEQIGCGATDGQRAVLMHVNGRMFMLSGADQPVRSSRASGVGTNADWHSCRVSDGAFSVVDSERRTVSNFSVAEVGHKSWQRTFEADVRFAEPCGGVLVIGLNDDSVLGIDQMSGAVRWRSRLMWSPALWRCSGQTLIGISPSGTYVTVDAVAGSLAERQLGWIAPNVVTALEVDSVGSLVLGLSGYRVVVYEPELGTPLWSFELRDHLVRLLVTNGRIIATTQGGAIYEWAGAPRRNIIGWVSATDRVGGRAVLWSGRELPLVSVVATKEPFASDHAAVPAQVANPSGPMGPGELSLGASGGTPLVAGHAVVLPGRARFSRLSANGFLWVDGSFVGRGVQRISGLIPGTHEFSVYVPGSRILSGRFMVPKDSGEEVEVDVAPDPSSEIVLAIASNPSGASVHVDGVFLGRTPLRVYNLVFGQVVTVLVGKFGFQTVEERVAVEGPEHHRDYRLFFARWSGGVFVGGSTSGLNTITGWSAEAIAAEGPQGPPLWERPALRFRAEVEFVQGRVGLSSALSTLTSPFSLQVGAGYLLSKRANLGQLRIGLRASHDSAAGNSIEPDTRLDIDLPLEYWRHEIPGVFVSNRSRTFAGPGVWWRPLEGVSVEGYYEHLVNGGELSGSVLIEDARFHLTKDPTRSYSLSVINGYRRGISFVGRLRLERILKIPGVRSLAARVDFIQSRVTFPHFVDLGSSIVVGIGMVLK